MALAGAIADPGESNALGNANGICQAAEADTCTSATYEDLGTPSSSFTFVKLGSTTALEVTLTIVWYTTGVNTAAKFGVSLTGSAGTTDYDVAQLYINEANSFRQCAGVRRIAGVAAGSYTVQPRWLRVTGAGTATTNTDSWLTIHIREVR